MQRFILIASTAALSLKFVAPAIAVPSATLPTDSAQFFTPPADRPAPIRAAGGATRVKTSQGWTLYICKPGSGLDCGEWKKIDTYDTAEKAESMSTIYTAMGYRISIL